jgi:tRNA-specific 2-thiouridylase
VSGHPPQHNKLFAKIRYRQNDQACAIQLLENNAARVIFDEPQRAVTPGQAIVFYDNDVCLGGAVIC